MTQVLVTQKAGFQNEVSFGEGVPHLIADEPAPMGTGTGPSPVELLASAVGNCLTASLYFALTKFKNQPSPLRCTVDAEVGKNAEGRVRVLGLSARLQLGDAPEALHELPRILDQFENYCTVTQSVRAGIPVQVQVFAPDGSQLK